MYQNGFWAMLDADDEYTPDFIEKTLTFINENDLDVVACGSDFIDEETCSLYGTRKEESNMIITGAGFDRQFHVYQKHMQNISGKIYRLSLLRKCDFENCSKIIFGADSIFATEAFRNASRVGVFVDALHKIYVSTKSVTHRWDSTRVASPRVLDNNARAYLKEKCGYISIENDKHLQKVYFANIWQALLVLLGADIPSETAISGIHSILTCEKTVENTALHGHPKAKDLLLRSISDWVVSRNVAFNDECGAELVEIFTAIDGFGQLCEKSPLLKNLQPQSSAYLGSVIAKTLRNDLQAALDEIFRLAEDDIPDEHVESYLLLAQNLCVSVEYADGWVMFRKEMVRYLIDQGREGEAKAILIELEGLLPDDEELKALRELNKPQSTD